MVGTSTSGRRKLTPEQREAIIQSTDLTCFLALDYGISRGTIYKIRREARERIPPSKDNVWIPTPPSNGRQTQVGGGVC
jgi:transposase-like protein